MVVLVDEYDRPIADALADPALAAANRDFLRGVYGVVKDCDAHIRLSFFTGVSKFPKVSIFSDLNNLIDITLDKRFATICGYTEKDLDDVFGPELAAVDRDAVRHWYNGYSWRADGDDTLYNPYGMLLFLRRREFRPYWFETGTPAWLPETLLARHIDLARLDHLVAGDADLAAFDIDQAKTEALLFQTGYLTIRGRAGEDGPAGALYRLGYPNREVRSALNMSLLAGDGAGHFRAKRVLAAAPVAGGARFRRASSSYSARSLPACRTNGSPRTTLPATRASTPASFYAHFAGAGLEVSGEESTSRGRADMSVHHDGGVSVFEFKMKRER